MEIELTIDKVAFGGDGIAIHDGKVVFVEDVLPGERVRVRITQDKKNFSRAQVVEIIEPSTHRQMPECVYIKHCGGCQYQHMDYTTELGLKQAQLREIFSAVPGLDISRIRPIVASNKVYGYRNGFTLHTINLKKKKIKILGFVGRDNTSIIPIEKCLIADDTLNLILKQKKYAFKENVEKIAFKLAEDGSVISDMDERYYRARIGERSILASSKGFFQTNLFIAGRIAEKLSDWLRDLSVEKFFDLYAGVGTFALLCAQAGSKIYAVEENPANVEALKMNRSDMGLTDRMEIVQGRVENVFPGLWTREASSKSMLILDPPRQGLSQDLAKFLSALKDPGPSLAYISCDPVTLARDLKIILSSGAFDIQEIAPFDMFPRTHHIETAVLLTPKIQS